MNVNTPNASKEVKIVLGDVERTLKYSRLAEYRMSSLKRPSSVKDLNDPQRSFAALVNWTWACLFGKDAFIFNEPEQLVEFITDDKVTEVFNAFYDTWISAQEPEAESPKANGSTTGASPASSSS